jgi:hypothetical protein
VGDVSWELGLHLIDQSVIICIVQVLTALGKLIDDFGATGNTLLRPARLSLSDASTLLFPPSNEQRAIPASPRETVSYAGWCRPNQGRHPGSSLSAPGGLDTLTEGFRSQITTDQRSHKPVMKTTQLLFLLAVGISCCTVQAQQQHRRLLQVSYIA